MPKVVDNYVFERKIGSGQYGDVYKGYNKANGTDIAIKAIKRQSIKGKFMQLLENQIKVLKTCDNKNIIKLYDIKKTANNFYLILQYCNEGDLSVYLKKKKFLSQDEAIEFLIQILNAFKTLVKHKIMHRDFKLANILIHDGQIKIADFGFSKLLTNEQFADTMLGSPLNMAPEVLGGTQYNNKADIWSIGTVFYQMLFGMVPYKAGNMVDLVNNIKNKPVHFPRNINNISAITQDAIRKMLVVDPKKRIHWEDLFIHPITTYLQDKMKADMQSTMKQTDDISLNMSKFYLKNNMVVDHPTQIAKKQSINNYTIDVATKKTKKTDFHGNMIRRQNKRQQIQETKCSQRSKEKQKKEQQQNQKQFATEETLRQKMIKANKNNANKLLHYRNIYVFLASVAEETMNMGQEISLGDIVGYLLIRRLLERLQWLKNSMDNKKNFPGMQYWENFINQKDYRDIRAYIEKQFDVFKVFYETVHGKIRDRIKSLDEETQIVVKNAGSSLNEKVYQRLLRQYARNLFEWLKIKSFKFEADEKKAFIHLSRIMDCLSLDDVFQYDKGGLLFNFRNYYEEPLRNPLELLKKQVIKKFNIIC